MSADSCAPLPPRRQALKAWFRGYRRTFAGLGSAAWGIAALVFAHRTGSMVMRFFSLFLVYDQGFSKAELAQTLSAYGLGSVGGAWCGGRLASRIGALPSAICTLVMTAIAMLAALALHGPSQWMVGAFALNLIVDSFRPAAMVAMAQCVPAAARTRGLALWRMAANAGMTIGPAVGGWLALANYAWLFVADAALAMTAAIIGIVVLRRWRRAVAQAIGVEAMGEQANQPSQVIEPDLPADRSLWRDWPTLAFVGLFGAAMTLFFQMLTTVPVFFKESYFLDSDIIGHMMALNGLMILLFEMRIVAALERKNLLRVCAVGLLILGLAYLVLALGSGKLAAALGLMVFTAGEMLFLPFANSITLSRAHPRRAGQYGGAYFMTYAGAFMLAPIVGMLVVSAAGWPTLWWVVSALYAVLSLIAWRLAFVFARPGETSTVKHASAA